MRIRGGYRHKLLRVGLRVHSKLDRRRISVYSNEFYELLLPTQIIITHLFCYCRFSHYYYRCRAITADNLTDYGSLYA